MACVRCYTEGTDPSSYRVRIEPSSAGVPNALADHLGSVIDPDAEPWATLAQATRTMVDDRGRQLAERLRADASTLNRLNQDEGQQKQPDPPPT